ncbi:MAG: hypothetical protein JNK05_31835 [Myxococcales bacterium]|nr:hypothetical protein [Myxococcales bacterium]
MASITYWNRLEPIVRSDAIVRSLRAEIRDPLWLLTRQWQLGEFQGEDAASPAWIEVHTSETPIDEWSARGGPLHGLDADAPLEALFAGASALDESLETRAELGGIFEDELVAAGGSRALVESVRQRFAIAALAPSEDTASVRFEHVCAEKITDGLELLALDRGWKAIAEAIGATSDTEMPLQRAFEALERFAREVFGHLPKDRPAAWQPERLRAEGTLSVRTAESRLSLRVQPSREGDVDWYSCDVSARIAEGSGAQTTKRIVMPAHVRFRGMPEPRFWDFEHGGADFGAVVADSRDVARLVVIDFALTASNDWFMVPCVQRAGTALRVEQVRVRDVFGGTTIVERGDQVDPARRAERWTMWSLTDQESGGVEPTLLLPTGYPSRMSGAAIEEVRFLRDEMANMSWAIEHTMPNGLGEPWLSHERATARLPAGVPPPPAPPATGPQIKYVLQTDVPAYWFPLIPVRIEGGEGQVEYALGSLLDSTTGARRALAPGGCILRTPSGERLHIREEELPRVGATIQRVPVRTRTLSGATRVWVEWRRRPGAGEGSSGLRFDSVEFIRAPESSASDELVPAATEESP